MQNSSYLSQSWLSSTLLLKRSFAGLLGVLVGAVSLSVAPVSAVPSPSSTEAVKTAVRSSAVAQVQSLPNGTYLYGESPKPEQIGRTYLVFEVQDNQVVGAFYMPRSSFDCAYGTFQADRLAFTVVNSYEQGTHPYSISLQRSSSVASNASIVQKPELEGFHALTTLSDNDQRILNVCKASQPSV